jgi:hypothetical protein
VTVKTQTWNRKGNYARLRSPRFRRPRVGGRKLPVSGTELRGGCTRPVDRPTSDLRCDCGYRLRQPTVELQVTEVRRHASEAHGISFSVEEALAVLMRLELETGALADLAMVEETKRRKERE